MLVLVCSGAVLVAGEPHIIKQTPLPRILFKWVDKGSYQKPTV